ncbi:hypothetical protein BVRB_8g191230 [Beta vulgaris subsp. vulgaris]|nr:hypothetical protein BVRB_8g191230 [Beta vulgaris subsp. vulgaris]
MAAQQVLNDEEQAIFDELISAASKEANVESDQPTIEVVTWGSIRNYHKEKATLQVIDQHDWSGKPRPYDHIPATSKSVAFRHTAPVSEGSKAGVVYADGVENTARKWLVAFDGKAQKVFVDAGPTGPTHWENVEVRLNESGSVHRYQDPVFGGKAAAIIKGSYVFVLLSN